MPHIDSHPPGTPCWFELATTDQNAAKVFYAAVFDWTSIDNPMGPNEVYTMFQLEGRDTGGGYTLSADMKAAGVPPHWMLYFCTADCDASVAQAKELGATVLSGPSDVMTFGRMAVLKDPTGATFSLWQPGDNKGARIGRQPGTVCWVELNSWKAEESAAFYAKLLGAEANSQTLTMGPYIFLAAHDNHFGGVLQMTKEWGEMPPHWMIYFQVADCDATAAKIKAAGGQICHGPFDAPTVGRIAVCGDPQGAYFSIISLAS